MLAASLLLLFAAAGLRLGFLTVVLAHVASRVSYAVVVVRARLAGFDRSLEEAAHGPRARGPLRTFLQGHAAAHRARRCWRPALLVFALSIDDYVVTSFVAGVGRHHAAAADLLDGQERRLARDQRRLDAAARWRRRSCSWRAFLLEQGAIAPAARRRRALAGLLVLCALRARRRARRRRSGKVLNLFIWSNYIAARDAREVRGSATGVKVNVDLYDSNEALLAKLQAGNAGYDVVCPSDYSVQVLVAAGPAAAARPLGAAAPRERGPARSSTAATTRATAYSVAVLLGHDGDRLRPHDAWRRRSTPGRRCGTRATAAAS